MLCSEFFHVGIVLVLEGEEEEVVNKMHMAE